MRAKKARAIRRSILAARDAAIKARDEGRTFYLGGEYLISNPKGYARRTRRFLSRGRSGRSTFDQAAEDARLARQRARWREREAR